MNPYYRISLMVCRIVAAGFMIVAILDLALYWVQCHNAHTPLGIGRSVYLCIPLVIGIVLLVKSSALARRLADYLDD